MLPDGYRDKDRRTGSISGVNKKILLIITDGISGVPSVVCYTGTKRKKMYIYNIEGSIRHSGMQKRGKYEPGNQLGSCRDGIFIFYDSPWRQCGIHF